MDTTTFQAKLEAILDASARVAGDREWCCEWLDTFALLSPYYHVHHDEDSANCGSADYDACGITIGIPEVPDPSWFITPEKYQEVSAGSLPEGGYEGELARIRGRIITLTSEYVTGDEAVSVLKAAGLRADITWDNAVPLLQRRD